MFRERRMTGLLRPTPTRATFLLAAALLSLGSSGLGAQRTRPTKGGAIAPSNVTVVASAASASTALISWTARPDRGVTYRVLRSLDAMAPGADLTAPIDVTTFEDGRVSAGTTYYYQVVGVYADGSMGVAAPVAFTLPVPAPAPAPIAKGQPVISSRMPTGARTPLAPPTGAPPGPPPQRVTVSGTASNAVLSWQAAPGAVHTVTRWLQSDPNCCRGGSPGLSPTARAWDDDLSLTAPTASTYGTYVYRVTARN